MKTRGLSSLCFLLVLWAPQLEAGNPSGRFFLEGDGSVFIKDAKTGAGGTVRYRDDDGSYPSSAKQRLNRIFGIPGGSPEEISLRLIALLDHLQDHFKGGILRIISGYRSSTYNEGLRRKGKLAAKTSLHTEGMAADIEIMGVDGKKLWEYVRGLDCCGAGFYHGKGIHIDTGPSRFWDETSTGVEKDLGARNKLLLLKTDFDRYRPGETVRLSVSRITDYPIGLKPKGRIFQNGSKKGEIVLSGSDSCMHLSSHAQARSLAWTIPAQFAREAKVHLEFDLCDKNFPEMPDWIVSNTIEIW